MEPKKRGSSRNRNAGHDFEKAIAKKLREELGFVHVVTTRSESRGRDGQGIDLMNKDELVNGRLPYNIQCKNSCERVPYFQLLRDLPAGTGSINVVLHKFTEKKPGGRFDTKGYYAIMDMDDFLLIAKNLEDNRKCIDALLNQLNEKSTN